MDISMLTEREPQRPDSVDGAHNYYRPDIDGLRALAVLAVIFYHAHIGLSGGYVGVDVFFVISGFLIGSIIRREFSQGTFSLVNFWERRIRRIVPAVFVMVLLTLIVGSFSLPSDFRRLGKAVIAQALGVSNVHFLTTGNYFGGGSGENPFLHTWSLAVEEQFYVLFPVGLLLLFKLSRHRFVAYAKWAIGIAFLLSLVFAVTMIALDKAIISTFFLLPGRAWELLFGVSIAFFNRPKILENRKVSEAVAWIGLVLIIGPIVFYTLNTPFPGLAALWPCLGATLLILSNDFSPQGYVTLSGRLLSLKGLTFVGLISYSLYLYHWPIFVYADYFGANLKENSIHGIFCIIVAFGAGYLSWRFVEQPFRKKRGPRRFVFLGGATTVMISIGIGWFVQRPEFDAFLFRNPEINRLDVAAKDTGFRQQVYLADVQRGEVPKLGRLDRKQNGDVLLWGDSHAMHAIYAFDELCRERNLAGVAIVYTSTPPILDFQYRRLWGIKNAPIYSSAVLQWVEKNRPKNVILAAAWSRYEEFDPVRLESSLKKTIVELRKLNCKVWVLMGLPEASINIPRWLLLSKHLQLSGGYSLFSLERHQKTNAILNRMAREIPDATFIDLLPMLYSPETDTLTYAVQGLPVFIDANHLTGTASRTLLLPFLRKEMDSLR